MIQSLPTRGWLLRHYDPVAPGAARGHAAASERLGKRGVAGRPTHDYWMNSSSSGRIQPAIRLWWLHLCRSIHPHADCRPERSFFLSVSHWEL